MCATADSVAERLVALSHLRELCRTFDETNGTTSCIAGGAALHAYCAKFCPARWWAGNEQHHSMMSGDVDLFIWCNSTDVACEALAAATFAPRRANAPSRAILAQGLQQKDRLMACVPLAPPVPRQYQILDASTRRFPYLENGLNVIFVAPLAAAASTCKRRRVQPLSGSDAVRILVGSFDLSVCSVALMPDGTFVHEPRFRDDVMARVCVFMPSVGIPPRVLTDSSDDSDDDESSCSSSSSGGGGDYMHARIDTTIQRALKYERRGFSIVTPAGAAWHRLRAALQARP